MPICDPIRDWSFTIYGMGVPVFDFESDYAIEYGPGETPFTLTLTIKSFYQLGIAPQDQRGLKVNGLNRIHDIEDRILALTREIGSTGLLVFDSPYKTFPFSTLKDVSVSDRSNDFVEVDITFDIPAFKDPYAYYRNIDAVAVTGEVANDTGTSFTIQGGNFYVRRTTQDRTVFKEIFRNLPVRVPTGPDLVSVEVTAVMETRSIPPLVYGDFWERRQRSESFLTDLIPNIGKQFTVTFDKELPTGGRGVVEGLCHLRSVSPSKTDLPDATVYDMVFFRDYVRCL